MLFHLALALTWVSRLLLVCRGQLHLEPAGQVSGTALAWGSSYQLPDDSSACGQVPEAGTPVSTPRGSSALI